MAKGQRISWSSVSGYQMRIPVQILTRGAELGHTASRTALVPNWHVVQEGLQQKN